MTEPICLRLVLDEVRYISDIRRFEPIHRIFILLLLPNDETV